MMLKMDFESQKSSNCRVFGNMALVVPKELEELDKPSSLSSPSPFEIRLQVPDLRAPIRVSSFAFSFSFFVLSVVVVLNCCLGAEKLEEILIETRKFLWNPHLFKENNWVI